MKSCTNESIDLRLCVLTKNLILPKYDEWEHYLFIVMPYINYCNIVEWPETVHQHHSHAVCHASGLLTTLSCSITIKYIFSQSFDHLYQGLPV